MPDFGWQVLFLPQSRACAPRYASLPQSSPSKPWRPHVVLRCVARPVQVRTGLGLTPSTLEPELMRVNSLDVHESHWIQAGYREEPWNSLLCTPHPPRPRFKFTNCQIGVKNGVDSCPLDSGHVVSDTHDESSRPEETASR